MNIEEITVWLSASDGQRTFDHSIRALPVPSEDPWWVAWDAASSWCDRHNCTLLSVMADVLTTDGRWVRILNEKSWSEQQS
jgi:hypothetical protein